VGEPAHLGTINTEHTDFCPVVTSDGKSLFLSQRRGASWSPATLETRRVLVSSTILPLNSRPQCAQIGGNIFSARLLPGTVRARSSPLLINAGRGGVLGQFFALLRKSEDVTDTRAFGPLGN
jgi:hypothetical protein